MAVQEKVRELEDRLARETQDTFAARELLEVGRLSVYTSLSSPTFLRTLCAPPTSSAPPRK
jgi:hypothetical protein